MKSIKKFKSERILLGSLEYLNVLMLVEEILKKNELIALIIVAFLKKGGQ